MRRRRRTRAEAAALSALCGTVVGGAEMRVLSGEQVSGPAQRPGPGLLGVGTAALSASLRSKRKPAKLPIGGSGPGARPDAD